MKTTAECYKALLDGEKLSHSLLDEYVYIDANGKLLNHNNVEVMVSFTDPWNWSIYQEPKWYENIPEGGVLCWVSDYDKNPIQSNQLLLITAYDRHFYCKIGRLWRYATPLTKKEIQLYMDNVPNQEG